MSKLDHRKLSNKIWLSFVMFYGSFLNFLEGDKYLKRTKCNCLLLYINKNTVYYNKLIATLSPKKYKPMQLKCN